MKTLIAAVVLFVTVEAFAQQPPISSCLTNFQLVITATNVITTQGTNLNSTFSGGNLVNHSMTCDYEGITFMLTGSCYPADRTVGFYTWTCDTSLVCPGTEGQPTQCTPGGTHELVLPAYKTAIFFSFRTYLCCDVTYCLLNSFGCYQEPEP
jgi:hypothetical protein